LGADAESNATLGAPSASPPRALDLEEARTPIFRFRR
jgi:hypothetical protein